jgi:hypothetical protein
MVLYLRSMASFATRASWYVLSVGLALSPGCKGERDPYPPPKPYPGGSIGNQGGGAGDAPTAGAGGAGGATGGSATTGTVAEANICECAFGLVDSAACGSCVNDASAPMQACESDKVECESDPACKDLLDCRLQCVGKPDAEQVTCIQGCYGKVDLSDPTNHAFVNVMACFCSTCAIKCAPSMAIACE